MENDFKVPTFEPKSKVVTKKPKPSNENVDELKEVSSSEIQPVVVDKESESAKCETKAEQKIPTCPYIEPTWSTAPDSSLVYSFEVLKGGQIVDNVNNLQSKAYWTIGKFQNNDIAMAHPTISRYHAVLQYRPNVVNTDGNESDDGSDDDENSTKSSDGTEKKPKVDKGWYLYDLNSTHGSFVNKMKVPPKTYIRIRVGYMLKFGASTRNYILQGPGFDEEAESELTITEMKELRLKKQQEQQDKLLEEERKREEEGISWGMAEDAEEETDLSHNPFAVTSNEELFLQDPKKTLRGYFEREGLNLDYKVDEVSNGTYVCRIELPITDSMGRSIMAEFTHKGKKKDCVAQCALEACRILDRNGLLRQANHEPRKRKVKTSDDDDDDEFYDRTAGAEEKRRRKAGNEENVALSYEQLLAEEQKLQTQLAETQQRLERYQKFEKASKEKEAMDVDDLDDFMSGLSSEKQMDKADVRKCRFELQRIKADIQRVQKLINVAKPIELPPLKMEKATADATQIKKLPLFGKKKTFGFDKLKSQVAAKQPTTSTQSNASTSESIEEFDDDEDGNEASEKELENKNSNAENVTKATKSIKPNNNAESNESKSCVALTQDLERETNAKKISPLNEKEKVKCKDEKEEEKIHECKKTMSSQKHISSSSPSISSSASNVQNSSSSSSSSGANNKQKTKNRQRNKIRHQIDIDDTEEDTSPQKYSSWMPPENQSGDGQTALNSKYGY